MPFYRHSANANFCRLVHCIECGDTLHAIYDPDVRDTCAPCGGEARTGEFETAREQIRREYLAKMREARRQ